MPAVTLNVADMLDNDLCISSEDGQTLFEAISSLIGENKQVIVSFEGVSMLISLFLNAAIGQLYGQFTENEVRRHLVVEGLAADDMELLRGVVENAKKYYSRPMEYDKAWTVEGDDEE
ncbi:STAS-like domain-containing protein [Chlorobium sp.]|nr:STAS-like domain-containing protein [Chlorobium sp.]